MCLRKHSHFWCCVLAFFLLLPLSPPPPPPPLPRTWLRVGGKRAFPTSHTFVAPLWVQFLDTVSHPHEHNRTGLGFLGIHLCCPGARVGRTHLVSARAIVTQQCPRLVGIAAGVMDLGSCRFIQTKVTTKKMKIKKIILRKRMGKYARANTTS